MIVEWLIVGSMFFWIHLVFWTFMVFLFINDDAPLGAFLWIAAFFAMYILLGNLAIGPLLAGITFIDVLKWFVTYFAIGTGYSVIKWKLFARKYYNKLADYEKNNPALFANADQETRDKHFYNKGQYLVNSSSLAYNNPLLKARKFKSKITTICLHWG